MNKDVNSSKRDNDNVKRAKKPKKKQRFSKIQNAANAF